MSQKDETFHVISQELPRINGGVEIANSGKLLIVLCGIVPNPMRRNLRLSHKSLICVFRSKQARIFSLS